MMSFFIFCQELTGKIQQIRDLLICYHICRQRAPIRKDYAANIRSIACICMSFNSSRKIKVHLTNNYYKVLRGQVKFITPWYLYFFCVTRVTLVSLITNHALVDISNILSPLALQQLILQFLINFRSAFTTATMMSLMINCQRDLVCPMKSKILMNLGTFLISHKAREKRN